MKLSTALRQADPALRLARRDADEQLLRDILATSRPLRQPSARRSRMRTGPDWRPLLATAAVGAAVVAVAVAAITVPRHSHDGPATAPATSRQALETMVFDRLDRVATGDVPVRQKSAITWSDASAGPDGGAIDLTGRTLYIAAACAGGGSIAIHVSGHPDRTLHCGRASAIGPIDLTAETSSGGGTAELDVTVTGGDPHYIAKEMAFPNP